MPTLRYIVLFVLLFLSGSSRAFDNPASYQDTLRVSGGNWEDLSRYVTYYVDSGGKLDIQGAKLLADNGSFRHWPVSTTFDIGINPHPLWLHLVVKNTAIIHREYWWAFYASSDSIHIYRRDSTGQWKFTDTLSYNVYPTKRNLRTRFPVAGMVLAPGETYELLVKVRDLHTVQHFIMDLTTPAGNLLWEKDFHWTVGLFNGAFLIVFVLNIILFLVVRQRIFIAYACYILIVIIVSLKEEYLVTSLPWESAFNFLNRLPAMPLTVVGMGMHYYATAFFLRGASYKQTRTNRILGWLNIIGISYGIISSILYYTTIRHTSFAHPIFRFCWELSKWMIGYMICVTFLFICAQIRMNRRALLLTIPALALLYFSIAGYYLNYTGLLTVYPITYPNYFYLALCIEFTVFTLILSLRYKKIFEDNFELLKEKITGEKRMYDMELEVQAQERKRIARDLHDDLGATLSTIHLVVTSKYGQDENLRSLVKKATGDVRSFAEKFSAVDIRDIGLINALQTSVADLNKYGVLEFRLVCIGDEQLLSDNLKLAVYRIATELMTNSLRHSGATQATIQLLIDNSEVQLIAEDNGKGYDTTRQYPGTGLNNISVRVNQASGKIHASSNTSGTTTIINLPLM